MFADSLPKVGLLPAHYTYAGTSLIAADGVTTFKVGGIAAVGCIVDSYQHRASCADALGVTNLTAQESRLA